MTLYILSARYGKQCPWVHGWPFVHPDGLQNIHDSATGVSIDGDIQVDKMRPKAGNADLDLLNYNNGVVTHKVYTDRLEPTVSNILHISGFSQVQMQHDLDVQTCQLQAEVDQLCRENAVLRR